MIFDINWGGGDYPTYAGEMKGSDRAKDVREKEFAMQKAAFDKQMSQLDKITKAFQPFLDKSTGFDPAAKASMTSQFLNNNDATFNQAGSMVREALGARGNTGGNPVGGDFTRGLSGLLGARAGSQSQGLLGINIQDAQQAIMNKFNAGNLMSGNAATLTGTQGVSGSAMSNALNQEMQSLNSGFGASFMSSFGNTLGHTLGGGNASKGAGWFGGGG